MITTERRKRAALLSIGSVDFLGDVRPGRRRSSSRATVDSLSDEVAVLSGRVDRRRRGRAGGERDHVRSDRRRAPRRSRRHGAAPAHAHRGGGIMRRVAITGIGAVTPVGNDAETTWQSLVAGQQRHRAGSRRSTPDTFPVQIAGIVEDFELDPELARPAHRRATSRGRALRRRGRGARRSGTPGSSRGTYEPNERGVADRRQRRPAGARRSSSTCQPSASRARARELYRQRAGQRAAPRPEHGPAAAIARIAGLPRARS